MKLNAPFRWARKEESPRIAELFSISSGGVADYVWSTLTEDYPGLSTLEIGARRYARENTDFSYENCVLAEIGGEVVGMLVAFPMAAAEDAGEGGEVSEQDRDSVLAPYGELEVPGSHYVCGVALREGHRGRGLGTRFMEIAEDQAREAGLRTLSLLVFEQNARALALYLRLGYREIDRRPVVPHPLIHHGGNVIRMVKEL